MYIRIIIFNHLVCRSGLVEKKGQYNTVMLCLHIPYLKHVYTLILTKGTLQEAIKSMCGDTQKV